MCSSTMQKKTKKNPNQQTNNPLYMERNSYILVTPALEAYIHWPALHLSCKHFNSLNVENSQYFLCFPSCQDTKFLSG